MCMYVHTYLCVCIHIICIYIFIYIFIIHIFIYTYTHIYIYIYIYIYICLHVYVCICIFMCMYTYIYTYTHTFIVQCIGSYGQQSGLWYEGSSAETIFGCESAVAGAPLEEFDRTNRWKNLTEQLHARRLGWDATHTEDKLTVRVNQDGRLRLRGDVCHPGVDQRNVDLADRINAIL